MGESDGGRRHPSSSPDLSDPLSFGITAPGGGDTHRLTTFGDADRRAGADRCERIRLCNIKADITRVKSTTMVVH